jgi:AraC family transcriptional regulator
MALLVEAPAMAGHVEGTPNFPMRDAMRSHECMHRVISLLDVAVGQLREEEHPAEQVLLEATTLLRQQYDPQVARQAYDGGGRLLAWQARRVQEYIDAHITGPVLVGDLCAIIQRSEAHFSRSFKRTFGESPHAFVIRRRLELAAQYMLDTDASLSDISLRCGFTDQAHLCKHFRQVTGETPASWRRLRRTQAPRGGRFSVAHPQRSAYGPALAG